MSPAAFAITTCQPGAEAALKAEVAVRYPDLKFAYSRPGFVTFKLPPEFSFDLKTGLNLIFAHTCSLSLGKVLGESFEQRVAALLPVLQSHSVKHVSAFRPNLEESENLEAFAECVAAMQNMGLSVNTSPKVGDKAVNLIWLSPQEWWLGLFEHSQQHSAYPGAQFPSEVPAGAPSRAYLKMEEALAAGPLPLRAGEGAVELGCSPGGASFALLERGVRVVGVDPADVSPTVLAHQTGFRHVRAQAMQLTDSDVQGLHWLFSDMNIPGDQALAAIEKVSAKIGPTLKGGFVTLKLKDWNEAKKLGTWQKRLQAMGFAKVKLRHLFHNRTEVCAIFLKR